jgi:hypothetical protein
LQKGFDRIDVPGGKGGGSHVVKNNFSGVKGVRKYDFMTKIWTHVIDENSLRGPCSSGSPLSPALSALTPHWPEKVNQNINFNILK